MDHRVYWHNRKKGGHTRELDNKSPGNRGKIAVIQDALQCNSPISYDNNTTPPQVRSTI